MAEGLEVARVCQHCDIEQSYESETQVVYPIPADEGANPA